MNPAPARTRHLEVGCGINDSAPHHVGILPKVVHMLDNTEPPEVFKPSDVCMLLKPKELAALGYTNWRDGIPAVRELAFDMRALGYCEILQKGAVLDGDVDLMEVEGPIRIRRKHMFAEDDLTSDW